MDNLCSLIDVFAFGLVRLVAVTNCFVAWSTAKHYRAQLSVIGLRLSDIVGVRIHHCATGQGVSTHRTFLLIL